MKKHMIERMEPFNELFFHSCVFNAFFPVIIHYGKSIMPFILNCINTYWYDEKRKCLDIQWNYQKNITEFMEQCGIGLYTKETSACVIDDVKSSLLKNRPVILCVDCFYESIREDAYFEVHRSHALLFYGYDDAKNLFHVIEHDRFDDLSYKKKTLPYQDAENSFKAYHFNSSLPRQIIPPYCSFDNINADLGLYDAQAFKNIFIENMKNSKERIFCGVEDLRAFHKTLESVTFDEQELKKHRERLISELNTIIHSKKSEKYLYEKIFEGNAALIHMMDKTINMFNLIRVAVARYFYSDFYDRNIFEDCIHKTRELYHHEKQYYQKLYEKLKYHAC